MNISLFILVGFVLSLCLAWRPKTFLYLLLLAYWLVVFAWSIDLIAPFNFKAMSWSSVLGITFSWHMDALARLFSILISGIGILVFLYAKAYAGSNTAKSAKLLALLQAFAISMFGIVLTDNTVVLFLAWELTTITSYLLIQFDVTDPKANQAAFNGMFISVMGGLAMLAGFILLHAQTQSWSIQIALQQLAHSQALSVPFYLLLFGAVTKSAQFPFYFWLPGAMKAPTPVSAYLHSATMVNAGIYLLARFHPLFGGLEAWYVSLSFFGMSTMLLSSVLSLFQKDLKAILAYTTLFALGSMVYLLASSQWLAAEAFALFLFFHALYKAAAFMWVGTVDKTYATRDITKLRGVGKRWPSASIVAVVSLAAMSGFPPFYGFVVKEMLYEAKLASGSLSWFMMGLGMFTSMLIAAVSFKCLYYWLVGRPQLEKQATMRFGLASAMLLVMVILALSLLEVYLLPLFSEVADTIVWKALVPVQSSLVSGFVMSLLTIAGGCVIFVITLCLPSRRIAWPTVLNPLVLFEQGLASILAVGRLITHRTQYATLRTQLLFILVVLAALLLFALHQTVFSLNDLHWQSVSVPTAIICVLLIITGLSLLFSARFLINMVSLAVLGLLMSAVFVLQGAPDVAMTQLLVEILTVIILVIALRKAKFNSAPLSLPQKCQNALISIVLGVIVMLLMMLVTNVPFDVSLSDFFITHSLPLAHGRNVVNVILVDFRAFDTFGEALVIFATALAIWLLLDRNLRREKNDKELS